MAAPDELRFRAAEQGDASAVAALHTGSWQRHYRGAFSDDFLDGDPAWGALLDNLHVVYGLKRSGVGTRLMSLTAQAVLADRPGSGLYLWVLEQNTSARAFYEARGGTCVESRDVQPPSGDPTRLNGRPNGLRYAWPDPARLLSAEP